MSLCYLHGKSAGSGFLFIWLLNVDVMQYSKIDVELGCSDYVCCVYALLLFIGYSKPTFLLGGKRSGLRRSWFRWALLERLQPKFTPLQCGMTELSCIFSSWRRWRIHNRQRRQLEEKDSEASHEYTPRFFLNTKSLLFCKFSFSLFFVSCSAPHNNGS